MSLEALRRDLRQAVRQLFRTPVHSGIAILVLAIGIGANTAVFSVVNPLLLKPLPFPDADRLVWIANSAARGLSGLTYRVDAYEALAERSRSFESMTAYFAFFGFRGFVLSGDGVPERLTAVEVAPGFFDVLGVEPRIGRSFADDEHLPGGPRAALLTDGLWRRRFNANPSIAGETVTINEEPYVVAGVLPASFDFGATFAPGTRVDVILPARLDEIRSWGNTMSIIGKLAPGVSIDAARAELQGLAPEIAQTLQGYQFGTVLSSLKSHVAGGMRSALLVLWAAVGAVLLIVCANLSNLQLVRSAARSREFAVRAALGASRARLVTQVLVEGLVLAACGAVLGVPLAFILTDRIASSATLAVPLLHTVRVDAVALVVTAGTAVAAGLACALLPALRAARERPQEALSSQSRGAIGDARQGRVRAGLVVAEIALATILLVAAGLLMKSFVSLLDVELGFRPDDTIAVRVEVSGRPSNAVRRQRLLEAAARLSQEPGIAAAGLTDALPLDRNRTWGVGVPGQVYQPGARPFAFLYVVGPGYFEAMRVSLRRGRDFAVGDAPQAPRVAIVNERLAELLYPGQEALGRLLDTNGIQATIVGVVADTRQTTLDETPVAQLYLAYPQGGEVSTEMIVRAAAGGAPPASVVRTALARIDPGVIPTEFRQVSDLVDRSVSPRRFLLALLGGFSVVGLALASLGIYGVVSYAVSRRVPEIGLRLALGATRLTVLAGIMRQTMTLAGVGLGIGLAGALATTRVLAAMLYGTSATDPATFTATATVLALAAAVAGLVPARRAMQVDPVTALRQD